MYNLFGISALSFSMSNSVEQRSSSDSVVEKPSDLFPSGTSAAVDLPHISTFLHYQHSALEECQQRIKQQESIKADYVRLQQRLSDIGSSTRYPNSVVPLGRHCVVRAELIHTNEILVFLGDGYFVERTSQQAVEIVGRRLHVISTVLQRLTEEKALIDGKMEMLAKLAQQQSMEDVVEIRERLDEHHYGPGEGRAVREKLSTDEQIRQRLDELEDEEDDGKRGGSSLDEPEELQVEDDSEDMTEDDFFKRPIPPPNARPRRSSLPSVDTGKRSRKKSVTFAPIEGGRVPERENKSQNSMFKQALKLKLVGTKCKSMDAGEDGDEDWAYMPPVRTYSEGAGPKLKKQEHVNSMDMDVEMASNALPVSDTNVIVERNVDSLESPSALPSASSESRPVSRFKASRMQKES
ncbi:unconventional prefoldin RPB5 interactor-like [Paramacrobiotus metropolitanus]|uniref:unconventional prefoldin RPB5 interactor-like n=1 Tax=Paramacrobiotus metropolitanus TaxID=2943436 RepID=UPI0024462DD5|nr:unconventional prefoldin RPB5 interactor-like [Paramacrobiotus metropolitanus]